MPYTRFVRSGNKVNVYKMENGKEVKAFTSHSPSLEQAHKTAKNREMRAKQKRRGKPSP